MSETTFLAATVTLSDRAWRGLHDDASGALLRQLLTEMGATLTPHHILPDDEGQLAGLLIELAAQVDLILTTGGTGISPRDQTPEATLRVIEKRLPGVEQALHLAGSAKVATAILSRAVAGTRGRCLIINLPGSPGAVRDGMQVLAPVIPHAIRLLKAHVSDCREDLNKQ